MANKSASRNWNDIQFVIAALSMAFSLIFWNKFAGPDRLKAEQEMLKTRLSPDPLQASFPPPAPTILPAGQKIFFGGTQPQPQIITVQRQGGGGGNTVTSTGSS